MDPQYCPPIIAMDGTISILELVSLFSAPVGIVFSLPAIQSLTSTSNEEATPPSIVRSPIQTMHALAWTEMVLLSKTWRKRLL
jgi:hypothetical protein